MVFSPCFFYKGETSWCRLTLTGQVAFITYLYNTISFLVLRPAKTLGCFWTNLNPPDQLFWVLGCWGAWLSADQGMSPSGMGIISPRCTPWHPSCCCCFWGAARLDTVTKNADLIFLSHKLC